VTLLAVAVSGRGVVDPDQPAVFADDEGFLRGRAAFETTRVYGGEPFRLDEHLDRFANSAARLNLPPLDRDLFRELTADALAAAGQPDCFVRLYMTPGREGAGEPVSLVLVESLPPELEETRRRGIRVISLTLGQEPSLLGGVKSTSYALNMVAVDEAKRRGGDDAVFLGPQGVLLEGPTTNIWWRRGSVLFTPAVELGILQGVTRGALIGLAVDIGYEVEVGVYPLTELIEAEEAFTSSAVREVMPVVAVDGQPVGDGSPGPAARALQEGLRRSAATPRS
jgi:branched-subunit amino acid aminotransferase/4-amino-4-deoxychorismate lyase